MLVRIFDLESLRPRALSGVQSIVLGILLFAMRVYESGEVVFAPTEVAPTAVVYPRSVSGRRNDVAALVQLDEGRAGYKTFNMQRRESNDVVLVVRINMQDRMANLPDVNRAAKGGLLCIITLQPHAVLAVPYTVRCNRRVVRDLLADVLRDACIVFPFA